MEHLQGNKVHSQGNKVHLQGNKVKNISLTSMAQIYFIKKWVWRAYTENLTQKKFMPKQHLQVWKIQSNVFLVSTFLFALKFDNITTVTF